MSVVFKILNPCRLTPTSPFRGTRSPNGRGAAHRAGVGWGGNDYKTGKDLGRWYGRASSSSDTLEFLVYEGIKVVERHVVGR